MLEHTFKQTITKITTTRDEYGDFVWSDSTEYLGKFREILNTVRNSNKEEVTSDAMAWLPPTSEVAEGDILSIDDSYFRVIKIVKARKIDSTNVEFLKCFLERHKSIIS